VDAFLGRRFLLSALGALDVALGAWTLGLETRYSVNRRWFVWGRAASQFIVDADARRFSRVDLLMLGVGIRTRLE
jgi:hypothetical protein